MTGRKKTTYISLSLAVRHTGLTRQEVLECVERRLVRRRLSEADLAELRRIRRLRELGVNLPGIEIIVQMRQRIQALQVQLAYWERMTGGSDWTELEGWWQRRLPYDPDEDR